MAYGVVGPHNIGRDNDWDWRGWYFRWQADGLWCRAWDSRPCAIGVEGPEGISTLYPSHDDDDWYYRRVAELATVPDAWSIPAWSDAFEAQGLHPPFNATPRREVAQVAADPSAEAPAPAPARESGIGTSARGLAGFAAIIGSAVGGGAIGHALGFGALGAMALGLAAGAAAIWLVAKADSDL